MAALDLICCPVCNMAMHVTATMDPVDPLSHPVYDDDGRFMRVWVTIDRADLERHAQCYGYGPRMN